MKLSLAKILLNFGYMSKLYVVKLFWSHTFSNFFFTGYQILPSSASTSTQLKAEMVIFSADPATHPPHRLRIRPEEFNFWAKVSCRLQPNPQTPLLDLHSLYCPNYLVCYHFIHFYIMDGQMCVIFKAIKPICREN